MSYPQPSANDAVVNGADFFRLNTLLASPGDIYESPQSCNAFALGPDSDISEVIVAYFDSQEPTLMNQISVTPDRGFSARLDANNLSSYAPANRPGSIYMWPANLWNPDFRPSGFNNTNDRIILETPRLDVIQFFKPQQSMTPQRRDKTYTFQSVAMNPVLSARSYVAIPYYGRKFANISVVLKGGNNQGGFITVTGHLLTIGDQSGAGSPVISKQLAGVESGTQGLYQFQVHAGGVLQFPPTSSGDAQIASFSGAGGMFDILTVDVAYGTAPAVIDDYFCEITVSDSPASFAADFTTA